MKRRTKKRKRKRQIFVTGCDYYKFKRLMEEGFSMREARKIIGDTLKINKEVTKMNEEMKEIDVKKVKILENIRTRIGENELGELMRSIRQNGLLQPIGVWEEPSGEYVLSWGHRRLEACKKLGWNFIPAIISKQGLTEEEFLAKNTIENIHRKDVSPAELGRICERLYLKGLSVGEIAERLALPKSKIKSAIRIWKVIPDAFKDSIGFMPHPRVKKGRIPASVADAISSLRISKVGANAIFKAAKRDELTTRHIRLIGALMDQGALVDEALRAAKEDYVVCSPKLVFNKKKLEALKKQHKCGVSRLITLMICGKLQAEKNLLYFVKGI